MIVGPPLVPIRDRNQHPNAGRARGVFGQQPYAGVVRDNPHSDLGADIRLEALDLVVVKADLEGQRAEGCGVIGLAYDANSRMQAWSETTHTVTLEPTSCSKPWIR